MALGLCCCSRPDGKGASLLKQMIFLVGTPAVKLGLKYYFDKVRTEFCLFVLDWIGSPRSAVFLLLIRFGLVHDCDLNCCVATIFCFVQFAWGNTVITDFLEAIEHGAKQAGAYTSVLLLFVGFLFWLPAFCAAASALLTY